MKQFDEIIAAERAGEFLHHTGDIIKIRAYDPDVMEQLLYHTQLFGRNKASALAANKRLNDICDPISGMTYDVRIVSLEYNFNDACRYSIASMCQYREDRPFAWISAFNVASVVKANTKLIDVGGY